MRASLKVACPLKTYLHPLTRLNVTIYVRGGLFSKEIFLTRAKLNCVESNPGKVRSKSKGKKSKVNQTRIGLVYLAL